MNWEEYHKEKEKKHIIISQLFACDLCPIPPCLIRAKPFRRKPLHRQYRNGIWCWMCSSAAPCNCDGGCMAPPHKPNMCSHWESANATVGCTDGTCIATQPCPRSWKVCDINQYKPWQWFSGEHRCLGCAQVFTATSKLNTQTAGRERRCCLAQGWEWNNFASCKNQTFHCFDSKWHFCSLA